MNHSIEELMQESNSNIMHQFLGRFLSIKTLFTAISKSFLDKTLLASMKLIMKIKSALFSFLMFLPCQAWSVRLLNLINLSMILFYQTLTMHVNCILINEYKVLNG